MAKNWIAGAIKRKGAFSRKAKAAGKSTAAFAREKSGATGILGKQARLAENLAELRKRRGKGK